MTIRELKAVIENLPDDMQVTFTGQPGSGTWPLPEVARLARAYWAKGPTGDHRDILVLGNCDKINYPRRSPERDDVCNDEWGAPGGSPNFGYLPGPPLWREET